MKNNIKLSIEQIRNRIAKINAFIRTDESQTDLDNLCDKLFADWEYEYISEEIEKIADKLRNGRDILIECEEQLTTLLTNYENLIEKHIIED